MSSFKRWFSRVTGFDPYDWQMELAADAFCASRLIRIPTALGKTEAGLGAWIFHAVDQHRLDWPRRLVWSLPMRVLVEQTGDRAQAFVDHWAVATGATEKPKVHLVMGGEDATRWYVEPECPAILIGTQDMLLSRALNRGYASPRARWPVEYGLLNHDCLWILDEVQLMDVGLATSAQLQAFRDQDHSKQLRPCHTWWMSATLQPQWLYSVDTAASCDEWTKRTTFILPPQRRGGLWRYSKAILTDTIDERDVSTFASRILSEHASIVDLGYGRITLVVCNTVERARETHAALATAGTTGELELVHSRFRPWERAGWRERFLSRSCCEAGVDRIIVATQVVEAGVDISAGCLITELAPWASMVQRFGRCARYGGQGHVLVIQRGGNERSAAPYDAESLETAWAAVQSLTDVGLAALEAFEDGLDADARARLYPYHPAHLLMRDEFEELFDTTPDLTGADIDISRFIRCGEERDLHVFWTDIGKNEKPSSQRQPHPHELCAIPFSAARDWLCGQETKANKHPRLSSGMRGWTWDWIDGEWVDALRSALVPGAAVCVDANSGGYLPTVGFCPESRTPVPIVPTASAESESDPLQEADSRQDGEPLSVSHWKTIGFHNSEVADWVAELAAALGLSRDMTRVLALAARWHDIGKAHSAFQGKIQPAENEFRPDRMDLAKAPESAWCKPAGRYVFLNDPREHRPAFRHELASALALFSAVQMYAPDHPALLGRWKDAIDLLEQPFPAASANEPPDEIQAVLACTSEEFDLLTYLVASHHGKVRVSLHAAPADQNYRPRPGDSNGLPIRGVRSGDCLPSISLTPNGPSLPELPLTLEPAALGLSFKTGASWRERTQGLIRRHGPATLGFLEAILRAADVRASQSQTEDPTVGKDIAT